MSDCERRDSLKRERSPSHNSGRGKSMSPRGRSRSRSREPSPRSRTPSPRRSRSYSRHRRSYTRSRSRSRSRRHNYSRYRSRSRSPRRRRSRSPMSNRRRHVGNRENPPPTRCLGVFGLSLYTQERDIREVFSKYGNVEEVQIVYDAQTGKSRGFSFVYFENCEDAQLAKERCNGLEVDGRRIRVDYSITQRAHTPTPGIYMGKPT
ncbi:phosphatidylinositol kinase- protein Tra2, variant 2 [Chamberlinius hualienensis]